MPTKLHVPRRRVREPGQDFRGIGFQEPFTLQFRQRLFQVGQPLVGTHHLARRFAAAGRTKIAAALVRV